MSIPSLSRSNNKYALILVHCANPCAVLRERQPYIPHVNSSELCLNIVSVKHIIVVPTHAAKAVSKLYKSLRQSYYPQTRCKLSAMSKNIM